MRVALSESGGNIKFNCEFLAEFDFWEKSMGVGRFASKNWIGASKTELRCRVNFTKSSILRSNITSSIKSIKIWKIFTRWMPEINPRIQMTTKMKTNLKAKALSDSHWSLWSSSSLSIVCKERNATPKSNTESVEKINGTNGRVVVGFYEILSSLRSLRSRYSYIRIRPWNRKILQLLWLAGIRGIINVAH